MRIDRIARRRRWMFFLALAVGVLGTLFVLPAGSASAAIPGFDNDLCEEAPTAIPPDGGMGGFFLTEPRVAPKGDPFEKDAKVSIYDVYGYGPYKFNTYDLGCGGSVRDPAASPMTTFSNVVFAPAQFLVALNNSVREFAYKPDAMWGWTNGIVQRASDALRERVFTVWGAVVLGIVGVWLLWGARGGNMSKAAVTAGWAIMVMALVTAVASWPVQASTVADKTLTGALGQISDGMAVNDTADSRPPAVRASGVLTETVLYRQWLRGVLGSADSDVARKYGPDLFKASAISWDEKKRMRKSASVRKQIIEDKAELWKDTANKIEEEDPDAYTHLKGERGSERIGAGMIGVIAALVVTPFDIMASLLILVAFMIIRLAVAFLPAIGTIGILQPAAGPLKGLLRTVVAAFINCIIFGAGSAVFLLAVEVIAGTGSLAGWQQILLIWITGLILWLLLRPYRRLTQLTGVDPFGELSRNLGNMHRTFFGDIKQIGIVGAGTALGDIPDAAPKDKPATRGSERPENFSSRVRRFMTPDQAWEQEQAERKAQALAEDADTRAALREQWAGGGAQTGTRPAPVPVKRPESQPVPQASAAPPGEIKSDRYLLTHGQVAPERLDQEYAPGIPPREVFDRVGIEPAGERRMVYRPGAGMGSVRVPQEHDPLPAGVHPESNVVHADFGDEARARYARRRSS